MVGARHEKGFGMKAVVFTLGCKVNECESDSLIAGLNDMGYTVSDRLEPADLYIVNTCAVTAEAEKKSRQTVSRIEKLNPDARIIFTGCAVEKNYKSFAEKKNINLITGTFSKNKILDMLYDDGIKLSRQPEEFEELLTVKSLRTRTFIKVQDGCNNFCSYCIVPYLRGRSRSRNPENVLKEIEALSPKEAVINGINLSAYDYGGIKLTGLMKRLKDVSCRIRLGSLEANVIDEEFLSSLRELKNFAPHFHLSLQSGSDRVLESMNRHYTADEYYKKTCLIREFFPYAGITTDIIVGFPTETEEDFNKTLALVDKVKFSDIHPFVFSPRHGTRAFEMKDLPPEVKKTRQEKLLAKKQESKKAFAVSMVGKTLEFLSEEQRDGYAVGYSGNYLRLYVKNSPEEKNIVKVKVTKPFKDGALADII